MNRQQLPLFLFLVLVPSSENSVGLLKDLGISGKVLQRICNKINKIRMINFKVQLIVLLFASKLLCENTRGKFARFRSLRLKRKIAIIIKRTNFRQNLLIWEKHPNLRLTFEKNQPHSHKYPYQANKEVFLEQGPHTTLIHLVRTVKSLQLKLTQCFQQADQGSKGQSSGETQNQIILKLKRHLEIVSKLIIASSK